MFNADELGGAKAKLETESDVTGYPSRYRPGLHKDLEKQLLLGHCATVTLLPRRHVPPPRGTMRAGHLVWTDVGFACFWLVVCIL